MPSRTMLRATVVAQLLWAGWASAANCNGNACGSFSMIFRPPGYDLVNRSPQDIDVTVEWGFGFGCLEPSTTRVAARQTKHMANGSFCGDYTANYVGAPPPAPVTPTPAQSDHTACNGPGMVVTVTSCATQGLGAAISVTNASTGASRARSGKAGDSPLVCASLIAAAATDAGLHAFNRGNQAVICGAKNSVTILNGTMTMSDFP